MSKKELSQYLFWLDLEMSGLNSQRDTILEISSAVTHNNLEIVAWGPTIQIQQPQSVIDGMDEWNKKHHSQSGLIQSVLSSTTTLEQAEEQTFNFAREWESENKMPLCGNTIYQDRFFLQRHMPRLESFFHYHVIDVSSVKELILRWYKGCEHIEFVKEKNHRASDDIAESINELMWYRLHFFIE